ncbi:MAG: NADH-quinone oxidoreductase subunit J [Calditrichaeota bacterium]|nr:NADH-quinone oxidoreductase subunit J [Calditrichota bacterium]
MDSQTIVFAILALISLFGGIMVVTRRNPVHSILFLVLTFFCFAGFYVMLGATFLAAIQVLVYAGAIMVLFLFVVMMLNLREPEALEGGPSFFQTLGFIVAAGMAVLLLAYFAGRPGPGVPPFSAGETAYEVGGPESLGMLLFTEYVFPVEIAGILLLAAVIGAVALAKRKRV